MEKLKKRIQERGLKLNFIADRVGVSSPHLTMMLNGNATMPESIRNQINELLEKVAL